MSTEVMALEARLQACLTRDQHYFRSRLRKLARRPDPAAAQQLAERMAASAAHRAARAASIPALTWPALPVVERLEDIRAAISSHQVVVVAGETGSGKTTQLPRICLSLGRGVAGMIGHTQPRRLAARAVAARLASELDSRVGELVGYKVRFSDNVSEQTLIKLMTDGMLLAEMQQDPLFSRYDTLIIDEAHERSLNIDFLLGYLKQLLPKRPDLKVIITSATIDHERIAGHFNHAPVVEVSGRSYPVTVHYRPPEQERELSRQVEDVLREIEQMERGARPAANDVLVFLSGERDIREVHHHLRKCHFRETEFLPLYARLGHQEQQRIFSPHRGRRVVLATNVAETSLTVPAIRYVIDAGTARISRYSIQAKVQRLPVEPVSRASAEQRAGRSGRLMPGDCFRLYSEEDFLSRPAFTDPEILRTNLAAVILQMADLGLGAVDRFPFLDMPEGRQIRDGYRLLEELAAWQDGRLTATGRQLARLPVDPRLGCMLLAAAELHSLREVLIIVAALAVQDPRERPPEARQHADQAHQPFADKDSDFLFFVNLWHWCEQQREELSRNQYEKHLKKNFLSPLRVREWREVHHQLVLVTRELKLTLNEAPATFEQIHCALLSGLVGNVLKRTEEGEWLSVRSRKPQLWPGSVLSKSKASWLMAAEQVETSRLFARTLARIEPEWIERRAAHLLKRTWLEPFWSCKRGALMAREQVSLFGLIVSSGRRVHYGPREPALAREMLIREGLVNGALNREPPFVRANRELIGKLEDVEHRLRRRDLLADEEQQVAFYDERLPADLYTLAHLEDWYRRHATEEERQALLMEEGFLLGDEKSADLQAFPDFLEIDGIRLPLEYRFDPAARSDGVTVLVPVHALPLLDEAQVEWLVPGLLLQKIEALIRALPKARRRHFVPVPDYVRALMETLKPGQESLLPAMTRELQRMTGVRVEQEEWPLASLPPHLRMHIRVLDNGEVLAESQDLADLKTRFADRAARMVREVVSAPAAAGREWVFGTLAEVHEQQQGNLEVRVWPALKDEGDKVVLVHCGDPASAVWDHVLGVARLLSFRIALQMEDLRGQIDRSPALRKSLGKARSARDALLLRLVVEHFRPAPQVRDAAAFEAVLEAGRGDFLPAARRRMAALEELMAARQDVEAQLGRNFPLAWAHAHGDIRSQLEQLFPANWWLEIPEEWLSEYPRYLKAIKWRIEKLGGRLGQDRASTAELHDLYAQLWRRAGDEPLWRWSSPLVTYRFLLEEYRVSLFAQHLGTRVPVSAKRLRQQWELC